MFWYEPYHGELDIEPMTVEDINWFINLFDRELYRQVFAWDIFKEVA